MPHVEREDADEFECDYQKNVESNCSGKEFVDDS